MKKHIRDFLRSQTDKIPPLKGVGNRNGGDNY